MASIVTAAAITHNPRVYWSKKEPSAEDKQDILRGFNDIKSRVEQAKIDTLVVIADDHLDTFYEDNLPSFCISLAENAIGPASMEEELGIPHYSCSVDSNLANHILNYGLRHGFDLSRTRKPDVDHAFIVPLTFVSPKMQLPIVPVFANNLVPPIPQTSRFFDLGKMLRAAIISSPKPNRVGLLASFTLSNEVGGPKGSSRDKEFNEEAIKLMSEGRYQEIIGCFSLERLFSAGNSTPEFLNYVALLGVVEDRKPDFLMYRDAPFWGGCAAVAWDLETKSNVH